MFPQNQTLQTLRDVWSYLLTVPIEIRNADWDAVSESVGALLRAHDSKKPLDVYHRGQWQCNDCGWTGEVRHLSDRKPKQAPECKWECGPLIPVSFQ